MSPKIFSVAALVLFGTALCMRPSIENTLGISLQQPATTDSDSAAAAKKGTNTESPQQLEALLAEAKTLLQTDKLADADRAARQYLEKHPRSADGHFLLGQILFREIQARASQEASAVGATHRDPGVVDANFKKSQAEASLAEFTEGAKYRAPSAFDLRIVALDYVLLDDFADADKWLTRSLEWNPKDSEGWYHLGRTKYNENRFQEAINAFEQCLKLDPRNVKAKDNLGLSHAALGRTAEAVAAYHDAIEWQAQTTTKIPGPLIDLGGLLLDQNRVDEAIEYLQQAVEIAPQDSRAHEQLGKAYLRASQLPKARAELERAVELDPRRAPFHYLLGQIYQKEGLKEKAKSEFDRFSALYGKQSSDRN